MAVVGCGGSGGLWWQWWAVVAVVGCPTVFNNGPIPRALFVYFRPLRITQFKYKLIKL